MHIKDQPKHGRTSGYDVGIAEKICERLLNGESLRAICADPAMPARATVFRWLARNQEFRRWYALAGQCPAEDFAFETLAITADSSRDYVKTTGVDGKVTLVFDKENFARQRLRIKARKMILARMSLESTATLKPNEFKAPRLCASCLGATRLGSKFTFLPQFPP